MPAVQLLVTSLGFTLWLEACGSSPAPPPPASGPATTIPLDVTVVPLSGSEDYTVTRLIVKTHPIADDGQDVVAPQKHILDTGTSNLAYCGTDMAKKVQSKKQKAIVCNKYGEGNHGFWGNVFKGNVSIDGLVTLPSVDYAIMQDSVKMCDDDNDGIFGIAFKQLNEGFQGSTPPKGWTQQSVGACPNPNERPVVDMENPLIGWLGSAQGSVPETLGIYWSGKPGNGEAFMYLDADVKTSTHYKADSVLGPAKLGEYGWYDVFMTGFSVNDQQFDDAKLCECDSVETCRGKCIMDTGTPWIMVPAKVYAAYAAAETGTLGVTFAGKGGDDVTIKMDIATLLKNKWVMASEDGTIMGLPLKAFYYTIYDLKASTMSFVPNSDIAGDDSGPKSAEPPPSTGQLGASDYGAEESTHSYYYDYPYDYDYEYSDIAAEALGSDSGPALESTYHDYYGSYAYYDGYSSYEYASLAAVGEYRRSVVDSQGVIRESGLLFRGGGLEHARISTNLA